MFRHEVGDRPKEYRSSLVIFWRDLPDDWRNIHSGIVPFAVPLHPIINQ